MNFVSRISTTAVLAVAAGITVALLAGAPAKADEPREFARCKGCHAVEAGKNKPAGPSLFGIVGARAGQVPGFAYSPAMKASGLVWNSETLTKLLSNPRATIPSSKHDGIVIADPAAVKTINAYLATLR